MRITRSSIIEIFKDKLEIIRVVNGYGCDIGQYIDYAEAIQAEPTVDCVTVHLGVEKFGSLTRPGLRIRELPVFISAAFVGNDPLNRADAAVEDLLKFIDENKSMGVNGMRVELKAAGTNLDMLGEIAELVCDLHVTYA